MQRTVAGDNKLSHGCVRDALGAGNYALEKMGEKDPLKTRWWAAKS